MWMNWCDATAEENGGNTNQADIEAAQKAAVAAKKYNSPSRCKTPTHFEYFLQQAVVWST